MIELSVMNLAKYYGAAKVFENISFEVKTGERIGLIGQNGCGKTTLMKVIMGQEDYQGGEISLRKGIKTGYLSQIPVYDKDITVLEVVRSAFADVVQIRRRMTELEHSFHGLAGEAESLSLEKSLGEYGRLSEEYERKGGYELETRMNKILEGLNLSDTLRNMLFEELSGGERTRVILAKILLEEPDILLLDEPTNHLDLATIGWLEGFLKDYRGSVLVISHDRYFLDNTASKIIELDRDHASTYYGNYSYYVAENERRFLIEYKNYLNQQKKIERMEEQIERYRIWGVMRDSDKMFRRAKELEKRLEKMEVLDRPVLEKRKVRFNKSAAERTGKFVLTAEEVCKGFEGKNLLRDVDLTVYYQESVCLMGKNGSGKSTFLKMIMGELEPDSGIIKTGSQVKIGYLPQHVVYEDEEQTLLEYFSRLYDLTYEEARSQLARVLFFKEDVNKKIKFLSGGEKSRLRLCSLTYEKVNFMVLDEPTNHLDIDSREVLEKTLTDFDGTLLFVSHDRYFIDKIADKIMEIEDNHIAVYPGDYSYYLEEYKKGHPAKDGLTGNVKKAAGEEGALEEDRRAQGERRKGQEEGRKNQEERRKGQEEGKKGQEKDRKAQKERRGGQENKEKYTKNREVPYNSKKLELLEGEIERREVELKALEKSMEECSADAGRLNELYLEKMRLEEELEDAYEKWENFLQVK